jgi:hypothetical protein
LGDEFLNNKLNGFGGNRPDLGVSYVMKGKGQDDLSDMLLCRSLVGYFLYVHFLFVTSSDSCFISEGVVFFRTILIVIIMHMEDKIATA